MFGPRLSLPKDLIARAQERAKALGYASLEEYVAHLIEKDLAALTPAEDSAVVDRLKGLGYL